jgi:hypothetical protein
MFSFIKMSFWQYVCAPVIALMILVGGVMTGVKVTTDYLLYRDTSVPTLIEQIQLVRRFLREVLKGSVLKQA